MMIRLSAVVGFMALLVFGAIPADRLKGFLQVESYEVRPGIMAVPVYSAQGEICSVAVEKRHFSAKSIDLDAEMTEEQMRGIFDELAPAKGRGHALGVEGGSLSVIEGPAVVTMVDYENVSLRMYGKSRDPGKTDYVVAVIKWKKEDCKQ